MAEGVEEEREQSPNKLLTERSCHFQMQMQMQVGMIAEVVAVVVVVVVLALVLVLGRRR